MLSTKQFFSVKVVAAELTAILALAYAVASIGGATTNNQQLMQTGHEMKDTLLIVLGIVVSGSILGAFFGSRRRKFR